MDTTTHSAASRFAPPNHDGVEAVRLQGSDFAMVAIADWPTGSTATMEAATIAKIYVIVQGTLTVIARDGERHRLARYDSIHIPAGEARAVVNESNAPAAMIVITPAPAKPA